MAILLLSGALWAQSGPETWAQSGPESQPAKGGQVGDPATASSQPSGPVYSQLYCSGFVTREAIPRSSLIMGSKESPNADRLSSRDTLFLRGRDLAPGNRYSIVRQVSDPNREDFTPEQRSRLDSLGDRYEDIGWLTVHTVENGTAIATFDFSCDAAIPGDILVPFQERPAFTYRSPEPPLDSFRFGSAAVTGHIVGARDFAGLLGTGLIVYTDFGSHKGAKPGDYLVISRGYHSHDLNKMDRASEHLPRGAEPSAVHRADVPGDAEKRMPNRILGELLVINVSEHASTAIVTRVSAEVELGDLVQLEGAEAVQAASAETNVAGKNDSRWHRMVSFARSKAHEAR